MIRALCIVLCMQYPTQAEIMAYIVQAAKARGIDPQIALRVASGEGLNARPSEGWQSFVPNKDGPNNREDSWGIYQLLKSHKGKKMGVGHEMLTTTGIDPQNPANWQPSIDYALDYAAKNGWSAWYGAKAKNVGKWDGIKGAKAIGISGGGDGPAAQMSMTSADGEPPAPGPSFATGNTRGRAYPDIPGPAQAKLNPPTPAAENSAAPDTTQPPDEPNFPATPSSTPSKSPQDIYSEYLEALSAISSRPRQPYTLNLQTYDTVTYE